MDTIIRQRRHLDGGLPNGGGLAHRAPADGVVLSRQAWAPFLPWALLVVLVAVDVALPDWVVIAPALAAVPALAAAVGRRGWYPLELGVVTAAASFIDASRSHGIFVVGHLATLDAIALTTVIGCATVGARARQERELAQVRVTAEVAQQVLLRPPPPRLGPARIAVDYSAAAACARIGGDLYDVALTRWGVRALIGDVRGKGLSAVSTASVVLGAFREAAYDERCPSALVRRIACSLDRSLPPCTEEFVTLAVLCLPSSPSGRNADLQVVNCGHPAPLLLRSGQAPEALAPPEPVPPLGVLSPEDVRPPVLHHPVRRGDAVLLYTDGITEARDAARRFYALRQRLATLQMGDPDQLLTRLHADVRAHTGGSLDDDAAALLLRYEP
ncbi:MULTISPECIES: PP2C family protein-serine/threonine phosphatase [unclassified Streptomyces]|uniref:PP2C family protein-serine/threonine phosphatase n=1 Tax=unclassified Streptomyces TaxID=2593676 RepID=UPI000379C0F6|nr:MULTISPECIES: PP2C family protein-serine/threonine phosphatase [unclassified Streptomyces]MYT29643.1 SpoIIE family protein phosphatase [Streptomyces sp. SID8354]